MVNSEHFYCLTVHVALFISLMFQLMTTHTIYTLKALKLTLKHLKTFPSCFGPIFKTIFRGLVDKTLSSYQVEICWHKRTLWNCAVCGRMSLQSVSLCVCCSLLNHSVRNTVGKEHQTHTLTDCNDIRPQTAQFHNWRVSTDLNLVNWQRTVQEPHEDGLENGTEACRGKFLSVLMLILVLLKCI
jgi:hypothetical protein